MQVARQMIPRRSDLTAIARLAVPVAVVQVGLIFMGVVDTAMVGRVSGEHLAAVALGNLYFFGCAVFGMGALFALDPIVSQAYGAGDEEAIRRGVQRGWIFSVGLTVLASLPLLAARPFMTVLGQPEAVIPIAVGYVLVSIPGVLPFYGFIVLRQTLQSMGKIAPIVVVILTSNVLNAFLNWILVYGNLGAPALGAVGSSWATTISRWFMMFVLLAVSWRIVGRYHHPFRREALAKEPFLRMVRLGAPIGAQFFLEFGIFGAIGLLMGLLGTIQMAAHQVALNLASLTFMASVGVMQAASVVVGQAVGAEDAPRARRSAGAGLIIAVGMMIVTGGTFLLFPEFLAGLYSDQADVLAITVALIPIAGFFQVFDGIQAVAAGVLRGVGDTVVPMIVNVLGFWLIGMPVSLYLGFRTPMGPYGLWWGLVVGLVAVSLFLLVRVRIRFGRDLTRIALDEPGVERR
jgi:MATE family, multidrug efflux pump